MTLPIPFAILIVFAAGLALSTQAPLNAALARTLSQPLAAAAVSFGVGFIVLVILSVAVGGTLPLMRLGQAPRDGSCWAGFWGRSMSGRWSGACRRWGSSRQWPR